MSKYRLNINKEKPKEFWIMNSDAQFFAGLKAGDVVWTDNIKEARTFDNPDKIVALQRWKTGDVPQIVFIEEDKSKKKSKK
jgi:hypothetical protein